MELNVKFEDRDLLKFFRSELDNIKEDVRKDIIKDVSKIMMKIGPREEKKIFRYIANKAMGHVEPPKRIDGRPAFQNIKWLPLAKSTIKRKGHKRKWIDSGSLKNYLRAQADSVLYWYGKPKTVISQDLSKVTYYSIFNYERKPFRAHDSRGVAQELKITGEGGFFRRDKNLSRLFDVDDDMDNGNRPIFNPMEQFLFDKVDYLIDEAINDYMEENYGVRYNVPTGY